ncbi:zinc finger protein [Nephila pilipes]|uniref:Zinc finger protein n=1 Tax=Nephila pilipes TaxID=299642 RepID=A0A8X6IRK1_NEPPI|nr:zinc finger protein [Nephila pilipes]
MNNLSVNQPNTNVIGAENFLISYPDVPIHESENFLSYQNPCVPLTTILEENELDFDSPKKEKPYLSTKNVSYILDDTISDNPSLLKSTIVTTKNYVDSSAENSEIKSKYNDGMALNIDNERQVFDFEREMPTFFNVPSPLMYETRSVTNAVETGNATQDNVDDNILTNLIFENSSLYVQDVEYNISEESLESVIETIPKSKENLKELFTCELLTYQSNQNDYQISQDDSKQKINSWDDEFSVYPLNSSEKLSSKSDYQDNCLIDDISYFNLESTGEFFTDLVSGNAIQLINGKESAVNKENIECSTVQGILECKIDHPETSNENEISLQNDIENKPKTNLNNKNNLCGKLLSIPAPETFLPCYVCNICGRSFSDKYQLKNHLVTHLLIKPYTCTICNRQYVHEDQLKLHLRNHLENKQYQCSICEKCFSCRDNLNSHFCIHSGKKNYICKTENNVHLAKKKELDIVHENIVSTMEDNLMLDFKTNQSEVCAENVISDLIVPKCIAGNAIQVTENEESGVIDKSINCSEDNYLMSEPKINQRGICAGNEKFILILPNYNIEKSTPLGEDKKTDAINENTGCSYKDNKPLLESGVNDLEMCTKNKYVFIIPNSSAKTAVQLVTSKEYDVKEEYNECFEDMTVKSTVNQIEMFTNDGKLTSNVLDDSESKTKIDINEGKSVSDNVSTLSVLKPPLPDNVCNICFKSFSRRYLKTHLLIHLSEKPFKCSVCKKQYIRKDQLRAHERKHSGEKTDYLVNHLCSQPQEKSYTCEEENRIQSAKVEKSDFAKENLIFFEKDNLLSGDKASLTNMIQEKGKCVLSIEDSENITDNFCKEKLVCDNPAVLSVSRPFCPDNYSRIPEVRISNILKAFYGKNQV